MNLSTKIGTLILASAMSLGVSTNTQAQASGGLAALGTTTGITIASAVAIGVVGAIAIQSASSDNPDATIPPIDNPPPVDTTTTSTTGT